MKEEVNQKTDMRTITAEQAQEIIDIACGTWKLKLASIWSIHIVLKSSIEITEDDYKEMRDACTDAQHELFDDIFGKDVKFEVGDWVIAIEGGYPARQVEKVNYNSLYVGRGNGTYSFDYCRLATEEEITKANAIPEGTPCLVRNNDDSPWKLAYSNGNGKFDSKFYSKFYSNASIEMTWNQVLVLDMDNLPRYTNKS